jgi:hypothetical protein
VQVKLRQEIERDRKTHEHDGQRAEKKQHETIGQCHGFVVSGLPKR